jgi:hypothetical protein
MIHLLLFETLQPLYQVQPPDAQFQLSGLIFSPDNLRFVEIRRQSCNIWEPLALVPKDRFDDNSGGPNPQVTPQESAVSHTHNIKWRQVVSIIQATERGLFFVGRQDGTIDICDGRTGGVVKKLRPGCGFARIKQMGWNEGKALLLSADAHNRCVVARLDFGGPDTEAHETVLLDHREGEIIRQALLSPDGASILLRTDRGVKLIAVDEGDVKAELEIPPGCWATHLSDSSLILMLGETHIQLYDWSSLTRLSLPEGIQINGPDISLSKMNGAWACRLGSAYLVNCSNSALPQKAEFVALELSKLTPENTDLELQLRVLPGLHVRAVIGVLKSVVYFLDTTGWVCSIGLKSLRQTTHFARHFFIPMTWHLGGDTAISLISKTAVAFAKGEELVVFYGLLEFEAKVPLGEESVRIA